MSLDTALASAGNIEEPQAEREGVTMFDNSRYAPPRGALFALFVVICGILACQSPLLAQLCTGTTPPCALTAGYAGPMTPSNASQPDTDRGLGTLYAYTALPNANDILAQDWKSIDTWFASSIARPTIVNGGAFVPAYRGELPRLLLRRADYQRWLGQLIFGGFDPE